MSGLLRLATNLPIVFVLLALVVFHTLMIVSFALGMAAPKSVCGQQVLQALGRLITALILVFVLWCLGWLPGTGLVRPGAWRAWLYVLIPLIYGVAAAVYAYTGDLWFDLSKPKLALAVALSMLSVGIVEETMFRGLVQYTFLRLWGGSTWGVVRSVLLAALIFGSSHMIWAAFGKPIQQTALQSLGSFLSGICYGAFVIVSGSLWPAIVFHGLVNAAVNIKIAGIPEFAESTSSGVRMVLLNIPILVYAAYLLWRAPVLDILP